VIVDPESLTLRPDNQVGETVSGPECGSGLAGTDLEETKQTFHAYLADTGQPFQWGLGIFCRMASCHGAPQRFDIIRGQNHYPCDIELTVEKSHPALRLVVGGVCGGGKVPEHRCCSGSRAGVICGSWMFRSW